MIEPDAAVAVADTVANSAEGSEDWGLIVYLHSDIASVTVVSASASVCLFGFASGSDYGFEPAPHVFLQHQHQHRSVPL